jgi:hypothetical protein
MDWYRDIIKSHFKVAQPKTVYAEEYDEITDEIERSLWAIKNSLDLPTEEIELALASRRSARSFGIQKKNSEN